MYVYVYMYAPEKCKIYFTEENLIKNLKCFIVILSAELY